MNIWLKGNSRKRPKNKSPQSSIESLLSKSFKKGVNLKFKNVLK
jgi:hypothetical protein